MRRGFTLIELLIVIAIIAILALIAVPNFLEAQVRAKVSRAMADMRSVAVAIEAYTVDWGRSSIGQNEGQSLGMWTALTRHYSYNMLTTPVAYFGAPPPDPFGDNRLIRTTTGIERPSLRYYEYQTYYSATGGNTLKAFGMGYQWYLRSNGPDGLVGSPHFSSSVVNKNPNNLYDSSNGTVSYGVIYLCNKGFLSGGRL